MNELLICPSCGGLQQGIMVEWTRVRTEVLTAYAAFNIVNNAVAYTAERTLDNGEPIDQSEWGGPVFRCRGCDDVFEMEQLGWSYREEARPTSSSFGSGVFVSVAKTVALMEDVL